MNQDRSVYMRVKVINYIRENVVPFLCFNQPAIIELLLIFYIWTFSSYTIILVVLLFIIPTFILCNNITTPVNKLPFHVKEISDVKMGVFYNIKSIAYPISYMLYILGMHAYILTLPVIIIFIVTYVLYNWYVCILGHSIFTLLGYKLYKVTYILGNGTGDVSKKPIYILSKNPNIKVCKIIHCRRLICQSYIYKM